MAPNCDVPVVQGGEKVQWGHVAGWPSVVKHHGVPLYEWNHVMHRSQLLVQLSWGPGTTSAAVWCVKGCVCKNRPFDDTLSLLQQSVPPSLHQHQSIWKPFAWFPQRRLRCDYLQHLLSVYLPKALNPDKLKQGNSWATNHTGPLRKGTKLWGWLFPPSRNTHCFHMICMHLILHRRDVLLVFSVLLSAFQDNDLLLL